MICVFGQRCADLRDDALELFDAARAGVLIGLAQPHAEDLVAREDVQRQVAVVVVVAVEETSLLLAVQRRIGGVQIDDDPGRGLRARLHKQLDQQPVDGGGIVADLLVAVRGGAGLRRAFQAAQRALAGQRRTGLALAGQQTHQRIVAQLVVVVEIGVAQGQRIDALRDHFGHLVGDESRIPEVPEAARQARQQANAPVDLPQQQRAGVGSDRAAVKTRHHLARKMGFKLEAGLATLCHNEGRFFLCSNTSWLKCLCQSGRPLYRGLVKYSG